MKRKVAKSKAVFRGGKVHVSSRLCDTCIFGLKNPMILRPGQRDAMVAEADSENSMIPCHETLGGKEAICRGFYNLQSNQAMQLAKRLNFTKFVAPPPK